MRVSLIDPSAFTPPYDRALAAALARAGAEVELLTSRFLYGGVPEPRGYTVSECFYRRTSRRGLDAPARRAFKLAEHLPDMLRLRRRLGEDEVAHYQWLTLPALDSLLLPRRRGPDVATAHYVLPPAPTARQVSGAKRAFGRMDAVIAHSRYGASRLREALGVDPARIRVIPHGSFDYLTALPHPAPLPPELAAAEGPVILFFGLLRPYKGIETLIDAFARIEGAELWVVGNPRMPLAPLRRRAAAAAGTVRFLPRFVADDEIPALFERADVIALPYRDAEHSGVVYTALAFGKPMVLSSVGGFPEIAEDHGAARIVEPEDPAALALELDRLVADPAARAELAAAARRAAEGPLSWDAIAARTLELYRELSPARR